MKFLLDENAGRRLVPFLKQLGYDVTVIGEDYPASLLDREVLALAYRERRILLTHDRSDFGELIFRDQHTHCGVLLFRLKGEEGNITLMRERLQQVLEKSADQLHHFLVVTTKGVRIRKAVEKIAA